MQVQIHTEMGGFHAEMGRLSLTYRENVVSAVQKRLNRSSCRFKWLMGWGPRNRVLDDARTLALHGNTVKQLCAAPMSRSSNRHCATWPGLKIILDNLVYCSI